MGSIGACQYPIVNYPGWNDARLCPTGLFGAADEHGARPVHQPLARELQRLARDMQVAPHTPVLMAAE